MHLCCLDLEGILLPEAWIRVARYLKVDKLKLTTRDIPDYDELMRYRLRILKKEKIRLRDIQQVLRTMQPLPGAVDFLNRLKRRSPVIILSDTYYEFMVEPMRHLGNPTLFCNWLKVDRKGYLSGYVLRQKDGKRKAVEGLKKLGFFVKAVGDSYNDLTMLKEADRGFFFNPPPSIKKEYPQFQATYHYRSLLSLLTK